MQRDDAPILEFDPSPTAVIEPSEQIAAMDVPDHVVLCFFQDVIAKVVEEHGGRVIDHVISEIGRNPDLGALLRRQTARDRASRASARHSPAGFLEELVARGCRAFVACGGAGVLVPDVALGHVIGADRRRPRRGNELPLRAALPGWPIPPPAAVDAIVAALQEHGVPHVLGTTWTTDAIYRETKDKIARRVAEGCLTVEMEAAAFFSVAAFRGVAFGQLLYAGDDLSGDAWDAARLRDEHARWPRTSRSAWPRRRCSGCDG